MSRFKTLIAAATTLLLLALLAGMALAASGPPTPPAPYGYGPGDPCSFSVCRFVASGRVTDAASGAPLAGAEVTLQQRTGDGAWGPAGDVRPVTNPLTTEATGRFTWLVRGGTADQVRVVVARDGYVSATGAPRALRADGALDVALSAVTVTVPGPGDPELPQPIAVPAPVVGAGAPTAPPVKPVAKPVAAAGKGCAAKRGTAKAACLRAAKLATALKACRTQKGSKRGTCEKRARALSTCDAKTAKKRAACRKQASAIGREKTKATKKTTHRR